MQEPITPLPAGDKVASDDRKNMNGKVSTRDVEKGLVPAFRERYPGGGGWS